MPCLATFILDASNSLRIERFANFDNSVIQIERNAHDLSRFVGSSSFGG